MVFLFLLDAITSVALYVTFKCGAWIVCNSANGVYYLYKKIKSPRPVGGHNSNTYVELVESKCSGDVGINDDDDDVCVILSREEYNKLKGE